VEIFLRANLKESWPGRASELERRKKKKGKRKEKERKKKGKRKIAYYCMRGGEVATVL
jgi:hypothetical protein